MEQDWKRDMQKSAKTHALVAELKAGMGEDFRKLFELGAAGDLVTADVLEGCQGWWKAGDISSEDVAFILAVAQREMDLRVMAVNMADRSWQALDMLLKFLPPSRIPFPSEAVALLRTVLDRLKAGKVGLHLSDDMAVETVTEVVESLFQATEKKGGGV